MYSGRILPSDKLSIRSPGNAPLTLPLVRERHFAGNAPFCNAETPAGLSLPPQPQTYLIPYTSTKGNLHFHIASVFL